MTLKNELRNNYRNGKVIYPIYKALWPDGVSTDGWGEEFDRRCEKYADYEALIDHQSDVDEYGSDYGVTYLFVFESKDDYDEYD